jgi:parallel beta-helix repeat protein
VPVNAVPNVIRVPADYPTIQEAIDAAAPGSLILVSERVYYEHLVVDKPLMIVGQDRRNTIIDGEGVDVVLNVTADDVLLDGLTIRNGSDIGVLLMDSSKTTMSNCIITSITWDGLVLAGCRDSHIRGNIITQCGHTTDLAGGSLITLGGSSTNVISNNALLNSGFGAIEFGTNANNNLIYQNTVMNSVGENFRFYQCNSNRIYHNNFINNADNVMYESYNNTWDDSAEGNYWDRYYGADDGSGGRIAEDGVGDTMIPFESVDNYPLINPVDPVLVVVDDAVYGYSLHSNSTTPELRFYQENKTIKFEIAHRAGVAGYFNVTIPKSLMKGEPWAIFLNEYVNATSEAIITANATHSSIYLEYYEGGFPAEITGTWIVPELTPQNLAIILLMLTFTLVLLKRVIPSATAQNSIKRIQQKP